MTRITMPTVEEAPEKSRATLNAVGKSLGFVPNLHRVMANSPAVLNGWMGLMSSLATTLDVQTRDAIALIVSEVNSCHYCLSAHTHMSVEFAKIPVDEIALNRAGTSSDPRRAAAVVFARAVTEKRGHVSDAELKAVRDAGYSDGEIIEIVALVTQFSMTNFVNNVAGTDIDFNQVEPPRQAA
jgi:uncharacterized peroxidase-related enzyme